MWISATGEIIPPKPDGILPGLRFVLGPVESEVRIDAGSGSGGTTAETVPEPEADQTAETHRPKSAPELRPPPEESQQEPPSAFPIAEVPSTPESTPAVVPDRPPKKSEAELRSEAYAIAESLTASAQAKPGNNSGANGSPWNAPLEWQQELVTKPLGDALLAIEDVRRLAPTLERDAESLDDKSRSSFERYCVKLHEELSLVADLAKAQLTPDTPTNILAERTLLLITNHVFKMIDRWDMLLGVTTPESAARESISKLSADYLGRVRSALLLWLAHQGISVDVPKTQVFTKERHHLVTKTEGMGHVLSGLITGVARAGYWQNGKLLRRAHVMVAK
jgi:hypothetical protein